MCNCAVGKVDVAGEVGLHNRAYACRRLHLCVALVWGKIGGIHEVDVAELYSVYL